MKLSHIKREHVISAAAYLDYNGVDNSNYLNNYYWVQVNNREYPFKELVRIAHTFSDKKNDRLDFESNDGYRKYIENDLDFSINTYFCGYTFITNDDISHFEVIAGKPYRVSNPDDIRKSRLLRPLVKKVNKWAELSVIDNLTWREDNTWQWSGSFKTYLWVRIFEKGASGKVFFVIGASSDGGLFYKIDCIRSDYISTGKLLQEKRILFDQYLKASDYREVFINKEELKNYTWDKLTFETQNFFKRHIGLLTELEILVNSNKVNAVESIEGQLTIGSRPSKTKSYTVASKRNYKGAKINWSRRNKESALLGNSGEKLVIAYEKQNLEKSTFRHKSELVKKVLDGEGYDIRSFDPETGEEIHIEVKTTMGDNTEPFYISAREKNYVGDCSVKYFLYRVYNYNYGNKSGSLYILNATDINNECEFEPTNFEVTINKEQ